jgi:DNA-binding MarR family transcriptional regulator
VAAHPDESPGFLLWRVTLAWQRQVVRALAPLDLTHVQFVLLAVCWWQGEHGNPLTQAQAAAAAGTDVKMTSQVLRVLEQKGLLRRDLDPVDARARRLVLTAAGRRLAPRAVEVVETVDRAFFTPVNARTAVRMLRALDVPR